MKSENQSHLQEEQILWAVIDEKELAGDKQLHLHKCPLCNKKVRQIRDGLQELGHKAMLAAPPFSRTVILPSEKPTTDIHNGRWLPFFGAAAMAGLFVFFYFMGMKTIPPAQVSPLQSQESFLEDEYLMREISEMVDYPLSEDMYEITGDNGIGFDEDFLQFVVPDIEDDFQSENIIQGGIKRC